MSWLQTYTGRQWWPLSPKAEDVDIRDIAHQLAMTCRYSGATREFYSVAQHSVICAMQMPAWSGGPAKLAALLHDASEAYICDIPAPLKKLPEYEWYRNMERRNMEAIFEHFGIAMDWLHQDVVSIDVAMLVTEKAQLLAETKWDWGMEHVMPIRVEITPWLPEKAEEMFLATFAHLADGSPLPEECEALKPPRIRIGLGVQEEVKKGLVLKNRGPVSGVRDPEGTTTEADADQA